METDDLRSAVFRDAEQEAENLVRKAETEASAMEDEERKKLQAEGDASIASLGTAFEKERQSLAVSLAADVRNRTLEKKWQILDELYADVEKTVLSDAGLYRNYLQHALSTLGSPAPVQIICRSQDRKILATLLKEMGVGQLPEFKETLPAGEGGFKAQFAGYASDLTVHAACCELKEHTVTDIGHRLFNVES